MDPLVVLEPADVQADPGGSAQVTVRIHNRSEIVEGYRIDVVGDATPWAEVTPREVQKVYPETAVAVNLVMRPPADSGGPVGPVPFGVRVASVEDRLRAAVAEGTIRIRPQVAATIAVSPTEVRGRRGGRCQVEIRNRGNDLLDLRLRATDPGGKVRFTFDPPVVHVGAGQTAWSMMKASFPRHLRGPEVRHQVEVAFAEHDPATPAWAPFSPKARQGISGSTRVSFVQRALVPKPVAGIAALALLGGLALAAFSIAQPAKPTVDSVAAGEQGQVIVGFKPVARARGGYEVVRYQADRSTAAGGPPVEAQAPPGAAAITATVGDLQPGIHCFRVRAKGLFGISKQSDIAEDDCTTVAAVTLPAPTKVVLKATDEENRFDLSWAGDEKGTYRILADNRQSGEPVQGTHTVVDADHRTCFTVVAVSPDGKQTSDKSEERCAGGPTFRVLLFVGTGSLPAGTTIDTLRQEAASAFGWSLDEVDKKQKGGFPVLLGPAGTETDLVEKCNSPSGTSWSAKQGGRDCRVEDNTELKKLGLS